LAACARELGFGLFTGVPCSYLEPLVSCLPYLPAANEGQAVAIACGAELGGLPAVAMFQNSGLGNAVNPLTSLAALFRLPILLIVSWRGQPGGPPDEPQHELMGRLTPELLDLLGLPWEGFPESEADLAPTLARARASMLETGLPYALLLRRGAVAAHSQAAGAQVRELGSAIETHSGKRPSRREALLAVQRQVRPGDAVIATTGYMGRCLFSLADRPSHLYLVGSMGCASSVGLGLALAQPDRRVVVLDGDGAALMHLGALPTLGWARPRNLVHVVLDNERHASTGGQETVAHTADLAAIAHASGYPRVVRGGLENVLQADTERLTFVHVKIRPDEEEELRRPDLAPPDSARRFRAWLEATDRAGSTERKQIVRVL